MSATPPAATADLIGHDEAEARLVRALASGRLPPAWLICGPDGVGKATLAYRLARVLLGGRARPGTLEVGAEDRVFHQVTAGSHPDLTVLERARDPKSGRLKADIPVDAVREAADALHVSSMGSGWRVVLIDPGEAMNRNAANALLKLLEEPPPRSALLIVSHRTGRLPPTIRSRCAVLRLRRLPVATVAAELQARHPEVEQATLLGVAELAGGSLGRALRFLESGRQEIYGRVLRALVQDRPDRAGLQTLAGDLAMLGGSEGFDQVQVLLQTIARRTVHAGLGREVVPIFAGEVALLGRLAAGGPLDRQAALWDKTAHLIQAADGLNLDGGHVVHRLLLDFCPATAA
ncbi:DNA polymerase III subunit delta' [Marinivivus vitaminiproducens]|uniref:DNA polymerase III subunit delta' n=1 Tax=Marinivivus vitaminiproducens TaxID=3035935 RepID=UPI0027A3D539|nr:DNA polymerase III subunit delta' [Geminicoccaceae bacterium SCSIO 64248]